MTKKEKLALEMALRERDEAVAALESYKLVDRRFATVGCDVLPPTWDDSDRAPRQGYSANIYPIIDSMSRTWIGWESAVRFMWTEMCSHGEGLYSEKKWGSQNGKALHSTRLRALEALRAEFYQAVAKTVLALDEEIEKERQFEKEAEGI